MNRPARATLATSPASPAPLRILALVLPVCAGALALIFAMPATGIALSLAAFAGVFVLPFTARRGPCPACGTAKTFPFSGFGNSCKGCGQELVLRGSDIHLLESAPTRPRTGSGRTRH